MRSTLAVVETAHYRKLNANGKMTTITHAHTAYTGRYAVCQRSTVLNTTCLRRNIEKQKDTHALILAAKDTVEDRITGLNVIADDDLESSATMRPDNNTYRATLREKNACWKAVCVVIEFGESTTKPTARLLNLDSRHLGKHLLFYLNDRKRNPPQPASATVLP